MRFAVILHLTKVTALHEMRCINFSFLKHFVGTQEVCVGCLGPCCQVLSLPFPGGLGGILTAHLSCPSPAFLYHLPFLRSTKGLLIRRDLFPVESVQIFLGCWDLGGRGTLSITIRRGIKMLGHEFQPKAAIVIAQLLTEKKQKQLWQPVREGFLSLVQVKDEINNKKSK